MPPKIDIELCNSCGICEELCPGDIIHTDPQRGVPVVVYPYECWHCGNCRLDCPTEAITIEFPLCMLI